MPPVLYQENKKKSISVDYSKDEKNNNNNNDKQRQQQQQQKKTTKKKQGKQNKIVESWAVLFAIIFYVAFSSFRYVYS